MINLLIAIIFVSSIIMGRGGSSYTAQDEEAVIDLQYNTEQQADLFLPALCNEFGAMSAALNQPDLYAETESNVISLVINSMAKKYGGIGSCSLEQQQKYTTVSMQTTAMIESLNLGTSVNEFDLFASVLGAIQLAPEGQDVVIQFYKTTVESAITEKLSSTLAGLLIADPDIMLRETDMFRSTMLYASQHDRHILDLCMNSIDQQEKEYEDILKEAIYTACDFCPESLDVLMRRLWNKLPELSWRLDDEQLHIMSKSAPCVSTIIELTDGRLEQYRDELSALLYGASSGHDESLQLIINVIKNHAKLFDTAIEFAFKNASGGHQRCLQILINMVGDNVEGFRTGIGRALVTASYGHSECLMMILPLIQNNERQFKESLESSLVYGCCGHPECLEMILPLIENAVYEFRNGFSSALLQASSGHISCLRLIMPLIQSKAELFTDSIGWSLIYASKGHVECLQLIVPLIQQKVGLFSIRIEHALVSASGGHVECLRLILALIQESVDRFRESIASALEYATKGYPECLQLILPIVQKHMVTFKENIANAIIFASIEQTESLYLLLPLVKSNALEYKRSIEEAMVNLERSGNAELVAQLGVLLSVE